MNTKKSKLDSSTMRAVKNQSSPMSKAPAEPGHTVEVDGDKLEDSFNTMTDVLRSNTEILEKNFDAMDVVLQDNRNTQMCNAITRKVAERNRNIVIALTCLTLVVQIVFAVYMMSQLKIAREEVKGVLKSQVAALEETKSESKRVSRLVNKLQGQAEAINKAQTKTIDAMLALDSVDESEKKVVEHKVRAAKMAVAESQAVVADTVEEVEEAEQTVSELKNMTAP